MRCPYCGGTNKDSANFCVYCGRDLIPQPPNQPASRQPPPPNQRPRQAPPSQGRTSPGTPQQPPYSQPLQAPLPQGRPAAPNVHPQTIPRVRVSEVPNVPAKPAAPEPPAPFPPRTVAQLQALAQGALPYTVVNSTVGDGRKKIVRIVYTKGVAWQQVATLYKAFQEQQEERFNTLIIQGVLEEDVQIYAFTNGQLYFDRNVRLGSLTTNRFQIETGNGFESDSIRVVLTE